MHKAEPLTITSANLNSPALLKLDQQLLLAMIRCDMVRDNCIVHIASMMCLKFSRVYQETISEVPTAEARAEALRRLKYFAGGVYGDLLRLNYLIQRKWQEAVVLQDCDEAYLSVEDADHWYARGVVEIGNYLNNTVELGWSVDFLRAYSGSILRYLSVPLVMLGLTFEDCVTEYLTALQASARKDAQTRELKAA